MGCAFPWLQGHSGDEFVLAWTPRRFLDLDWAVVHHHELQLLHWRVRLWLVRKGPGALLEEISQPYLWSFGAVMPERKKVARQQNELTTRRVQMFLEGCCRDH